MLNREHSDFAWFKQRTSNIQAQDPSSHSTRASVSAPLNAEPTNAFERDAIDLPPKSYADAAKEPPGAEAELQSQPVPSSSSSVTAVDPNEVSYRRSSDDPKELHERQIGASGDGNLTSVKLEHNSGHAPRHDLPLISKDRKTGPQAMKRKESGQAPLASGRTAGAGWHRSAIHWAPLNVPLQRRLQMVAVLFHSTCIALSLSLFFLMCAIPLTWPLLIPYLIYTLIFSDEAESGTLRRRSEWLRRSKVFSAFASYFPARLHRTVALEPTRKYIFGYHPHGIISHGAFAAFSTEALGFADLYPGITNTLLTLDANFRVPIYRDYALAMGLASVSRESIENILSKGGLNGEGMGRAVTIVVGGARESLDSQPYYLRLVLNVRKGFVKIAIRQGADLVPVLAFGENDLYDQVDSEEHPYVHKLQMFVKKMMGFTVPLFHARGIFNYDVGLMPYRRPVNIVVGKPIKVVQQGGKEGKVDEEYLEEVHAKYVAELKRIWEEYKDTFARDREDELQTVE